jgi:hypothetical protein
MSSEHFGELSKALGAAARVRRVAPGLHVVEVVRPHAVDDHTVADLYRQLTPIATRVFGATAQEWTEFFDAELGARAFARRARFFVFANDDGQLVGWSSCWQLPDDVHGLFFDTSALLPGYRGRRATTRAYLPVITKALLRRPLRPVHIIGLACNPVVFSMEARALGGGHVYPRLGESPPDEVGRVARATTDWLVDLYRTMGLEGSITLDPDTLVVSGLWPPMSVEPDEHSGDPRLDSWMHEQLTPTDAILGITRANLWDCTKIGVALGLRRLRGGRSADSAPAQSS